MNKVKMYKYCSARSRASTIAGSRKGSAGFVLITAVIFLMVLATLTVMAVRSTMTEANIAGIEADMELARQNAELALRDGEKDIQGLRTDGQLCSVVPCTYLRSAGSRPTTTLTINAFWGDFVSSGADTFEFGGSSESASNLGQYSLLAGTTCGKSIWSGVDWKDNVSRSCNSGVTALSVPYGKFTEAYFPDEETTKIKKPRYIIELIQPSDIGYRLGESAKVYFRITAVGFGRLTGVGAGGAPTTVTLQTTFSPS
jgi:type IV pilus assembly protein PilX